MKCLLIEDDAASADALAGYLRTRGLEVATAASLAEAREQIAERRFDLVLLDVQLPDGNGTDLLPELENVCDVVMVSGESTIDDAIEALRRGALDFLPKPIDMARLAAILANLNRRVELRGRVHELERQLLDLGRFGDMVGASQAMQHVYECIERVAPTNETVLIVGPSGTGKEVAAATIQKLSRRRDKPFVTVNCGAISASLIESELFGHERGAFTGADRRRKGLFEQADTGTLFLDEITEMPIDLQVRLLRVLETGRFPRVGGQEDVQIDVRVIAATNRELEAAVADGKLRQDLLYRLLVFPVNLPPLKEREGDVARLAKHFLELLDQEYASRRTLTASALRRLEAHDWPGNVRELYNTLRRAYIMAKDEVEPRHLMLPDSGDFAATAAAEPAPAVDGALPVRTGMTVAEAERILIEATLTETKGNKKEAARILGISLKTLYTRLQVYAARNG